MKLPTLKVKKITGLVLSGALLATQSLFAYQPEKNFWAERRRAAQRGTSTLLASLPQSVPGPTSLAAQFPSPQILRTSLNPSVARSVPKTFLTGHADLLAALSPAHGSVRKVSLGKNAGARGPVVIHIQDVHMNAEAQKNIRETVATLLKSGSVGLVALEGSTEDIALQPFVDFPNRKAVELTADYLLRENKISGPIHAAMTAQGKLPRILGIDDPAHYAANVQAYKDSAPKLDETRRLIKAHQLKIDEQKKAVFSPALLALDETVSGYRADSVSLGNYVGVLVEIVSRKENNYSRHSGMGLAGIHASSFQNVDKLAQALNTERSLDFKQVEAERSRLIEKLTNSLNTQEINELMAQSVAYRTGELRYGDFYGRLRETCAKKGIRLSDYPAMDEYVRYVLLCDGIDAEKLLNEMVSLEKAAYDTLAATSEEKNLAAQSRHAWLTSKLVDFGLTPPEWKEYKSHLTKKDPSLASFEAFYQEAEARDTAMAKNVLNALDLKSKSGPALPPIALLVTGGFHAEGMAEQLTENGATVISFTPKIEKVDTAQGSAYLSVFTQEKTPLEKLFQGEKLFLSPNMVRAAKEIGAPVVAGVTSAVDLDLSIEKPQALRTFLDETIGGGVEVRVKKSGEDLEKRTVKISIKIGTKEMIVELEIGPRFKIISVNGQKPEAPSRLIDAYMGMVSRLHTRLGPLAGRIVKFTESPTLWSLPFWGPAQIAWWLTHHPAEISSVSDVVWQLSFLEGFTSKMNKVKARSIVPFLETLWSLLGPQDAHSGFNLISPSKATSSTAINDSEGQSFHMKNESARVLYSNLDENKKGEFSTFRKAVGSRVNKALGTVLKRPITPLDLWVAFEMLRRNDELPKVFDPTTNLEGQRTTGSFISMEEIDKFRLEDNLSKLESFRANLNGEGSQIELSQTEDVIVGCLMRLNNGKDEEKGLFKFFYKLVFDAIDVYGGPNPLKVFGIMYTNSVDKNINDLLDHVLDWSFDRHYKEQIAGDQEVLSDLSNYSRGVREYTESSSYDEIINDYSVQGVSLFGQILEREPTNDEIKEIIQRAEEYFVNNFGSDGYTLSWSYLLQAHLIAQSGNETKGDVPDASNTPGSATGWIGVGAAWVWGMAVGVFKMLNGRLDAGKTILSFAREYVSHEGGRRAARAEDILNAMVSFGVGLVAGHQWDVLSWLSLGTLSPPLGMILSVALIIIIWFLPFIGSHFFFRKALIRLLGIKPSVAKAARLLLYYLVPLTLTALIGYGLAAHDFSPLLSVLIPILMFHFVRSYHDQIDEKVNKSIMSPNMYYLAPLLLTPLMSCIFVPFGLSPIFSILSAMVAAILINSRIFKFVRSAHDRINGEVKKSTLSPVLTSNEKLGDRSDLKSSLQRAVSGGLFGLSERVNNYLSKSLPVEDRRVLFDVFLEVLDASMEEFKGWVIPAGLREKIVSDPQRIRLAVLFLSQNLDNEYFIVLLDLLDGELNSEERRILWGIFNRYFPRKVIQNFDELPKSIVRTISLEIDGSTARLTPLRVLDMGCGPKAGGLCVLKDRFGGKIDAVGVDFIIDPPRHRDDVLLVESDFRSLPFENDSFDLVYESALTGYFRNDQDFKELLRETLRVLKPGGRLIVTARTVNSSLLSDLPATLRVDSQSMSFVITKDPLGLISSRVGDLPFGSWTDEQIKDVLFEQMIVDLPDLFKTLLGDQVIKSAERKRLFSAFLEVVRESDFEKKEIDFPEGLIYKIIDDENRFLLAVSCIAGFDIKSFQMLNELIRSELGESETSVWWGNFSIMYPFNRTFPMPYFDLLEKQIIEIEKEESNKPVVLDLGCGSEGQAIRDVKRRFGERISAYGIDLNVHSDENVNEVTLVRHDFRNMPFGDDTFDVIFELGVTAYFRNDRDFRILLREIVRVLKPGGRFVLTNRGANDNLLEGLNATLRSAYPGKEYPLIIEKKIVGRATDLWAIKFVEWLGSKVDPVNGRARFGGFYKRFAALIEWSFSAKVAFWGFVGTMAFAAAPLGWAVAPAMGAIYGILFVASHFIPESMAPVTKVKVGVLQALTMGVIYGVLISATPFLLGAVPLLGIPEFGIQAGGAVWALAGLLHHSFDKENLGEEGKEAAWKMIEQLSHVQGTFEAVMPGVHNGHTEQIVGRGSLSPEFMTETLSRLKTDKQFRAGFLGAVQKAIEEGNLSPSQMNLLSVLVKGATGQQIAVFHILGISPQKELEIFEALMARADPSEEGGFSLGLVVPAGQAEDVAVRIAALRARGVQVFEVTLGAEGWNGDHLRILEGEMSAWLNQASGIVATVGTKVGINPKDIESLDEESKLRAALKNAVTLGDVVQTFLLCIRALASNA